MPAGRVGGRATGRMAGLIAWRKNQQRQQSGRKQSGR